jgi:hypothetical protein
MREPHCRARLVSGEVGWHPQHALRSGQRQIPQRTRNSFECFRET